MPLICMPEERLVLIQACCRHSPYSQHNPRQSTTLQSTQCRPPHQQPHALVLALQVLPRCHFLLQQLFQLRILLAHQAQLLIAQGGCTRQRRRRRRMLWGRAGRDRGGAWSQGLGNCMSCSFAKGLAPFFTNMRCGLKRTAACKNTPWRAAATPARRPSPPAWRVLSGRYHAAVQVHRVQGGERGVAFRAAGASSCAQPGQSAHLSEVRLCARRIEQEQRRRAAGFQILHMRASGIGWRTGSAQASGQAGEAAARHQGEAADHVKGAW